MRSTRPISALLALSVLLSPAVVAQAQSVTDAESEADEARQRSRIATGLVDEAVANRDDLERQLAEAISRANELAARLSIVGADLDRTAAQIGFADLELATIQADLEVQAVDAYMTVLSSPSVSVMNSSSVEKAMVAGSVVEGVVSAGRATVDELVIKRRSLEELKVAYLAQQEEFEALAEELDAEVEELATLYEQADSAVAAAVRNARVADAEYRAALGVVDQARIREEERQRQENRSTTTTSSTTSTTAPSQTTTTSASGGAGGGGGGGGGSPSHPPRVEQWRGLVERFFPSHRVEEALTIINCESNGDPNAYNPFSGASGLFQFLPPTWASTAPQAGYPDASPFEPEPNTASAAWLANRYEELGLDYWGAWSCRRVLD